MTNQDLPDAGSHQSDQESSRHYETSETDARPAHESHSPALTSVPAAQESTSSPKDSNKAPSHQLTFSTFTEFGDGQGLGGMVLSLVPNPGVPNYQLGPWAALIQVKCRDIARLMREGFNWSTGNILPEEGCMFHATDAKWSALGFRYARRWIIVDKPDDGQERQWVARLDVLTPCFDILRGFRLENLSRQNVWAARTWNGLPQAVYQYEFLEPGKNYNCIYGDKPLHGWWPWPKEAEVAPDVGGSAPAAETREDVEC